MIRTPFDRFAKSVVVDHVGPRGTAVSEQEISSDTQRADLSWTPDPARLASHPPRDLLDSMANVASLWEFFHHAPSLWELLMCLQKLIAWHAILRRAAFTAKEKPPRLPPPTWILAANASPAIRAAMGLVPMSAAWGPGFYSGPPGDRLRAVVLRELPRTPATLLLRLLGSGATFRDALDDLAALPPDAHERAVVLPQLERLRLTLPGLSSTEEKKMKHDELLRITEKLHLEYVQSLKDEGFSRGVAKGVAPMVHLFSRRLGRALTDAEHTSIAARLDALGPVRLGDVVLDLDGPALAAWLADPDAR